MNRKEASFILANIDRRVCDDELNEALDMAIKALEQEPKTDSWSIKDVADTFKKHGLIRVQEPSGNAINRKLVCAFIDGLISDDVEREKGLEYIRNMPPVTPQPKTGYWIREKERHFLDTRTNENVEMKEATGKGYHTYINVQCSKCRKITIHDDSILYQYCPHCGAKMVEPQERSDKE